MDPLGVLLIFATGLAMGWINNLAGAAGALGLIALEEFAGLDEVQANASLRLAAVAIGVSGLLGFLSKKQKVPARMWGLAALTIPGAVLGSILVVTLPVWVFQASLATVVALVLLQQLLHKPGPAGSHPPEKPAAARPRLLLILLFSWFGLHMGFIQVAVGLVAIFILSMVHSRDLVQVNAAKMVFVIVASLTSTTSLAFTGKVAWGPAAALAVGCGIGSFLASRWSVRKGHSAVRVVVLLICVFVLTRLAFRLFG